MSDPLSAAASVIGLLTAAAQVSKILADVIEKARHAPDECRRIKAEVDEIRNVLSSLQLFIVGNVCASRSRTSLIMVEQVVVTLAACVTAFSELDTFATALQSEMRMSILDRLRWVTKEKDIKHVLVRLETHKSSLALMLMILTWMMQRTGSATSAKIGAFIKEKGTDVKDIFAVSGHPTLVMRLQTAFETPPKYGTNHSLAPYSVHDAAGVLLRYLKSLPEPIVSYSHYEQFVDEISPAMEASSHDWETEAISIAQRSIRALPSLSRQLWLYLRDIMAVFASKSDDNQMPALRLVSAFQPSILSGPPATMDADAHHLTIRITVFLVENQDHFLLGQD
ncbi:rhoGAP domain-containing protein [Hirsutella rhossiliensis]|uniref:RhoGAP domain-containing protein n=1 Tax=Hirsutella rhossiliensis TaxID=111463 RepID=A0A9P8MQJ3_9HYPO|nr:rhoGAP domain-containing protein [Hirsutella rhossiliensis]KAH0959455.1 rhoGAP domain-containing protein [Hirsutella rhossiliensis]